MAESKESTSKMKKALAYAVAILVGEHNAFDPCGATTQFSIGIDRGRGVASLVTSVVGPQSIRTKNVDVAVPQRHKSATSCSQFCRRARYRGATKLCKKSFSLLHTIARL